MVASSFVDLPKLTLETNGILVGKSECVGFNTGAVGLILCPVVYVC